jgi:predicted RNA binding protein YcfA (HicA-like mRNA interferase family)
MKPRKLLQKILSGARNIKFTDFIHLVEAFGFHLSRIKGSHHMFVHPDVDELVNIQDVNGEAKPYQIKQFLELVEAYDLRMEDSK